jgi:sodium transport system permease protein
VSLRTIRVILFKELLDVARDRRALAFMVLLPIAIVPALVGGMGKLMAFGKRKLLEEPSKVAVMGAEHAPKVDRLLRSFESLASLALAPDEFTLASMEQALASGGGEPGAARPQGAGPDPAAIGKVLGEDIDLAKVSLLKVVDPPPLDRNGARAAVEKRDLDLVVVIPEGFAAALEGEGTASLTMVYDSSFDRSRTAFRKARDILATFERGVVLRRLPKRGLEKGFLDPVRVVEATVASKEQEGRAALALILPYLLILMCFSGAVYPAIDLGAGEKERGTLETLLVSPAGRAEIVVGKLLVIFATSLLAAALNIGSLAITLESGAFADLGKTLPFSVDPVAAGVALLLMLPVAAIFASVLLAVSIFAKSFKEAQAYFAPFNIALILPAFVSAIPGVELNRALALVPIVNVSLAIKEALAGTYKWDALALIVLSTAALAALSVAFCARWFRREDVLFRS